MSSRSINILSTMPGVDSKHPCTYRIYHFSSFILAMFQVFMTSLLLWCFEYILSMPLAHLAKACIPTPIPMPNLFSSQDWAPHLCTRYQLGPINKNLYNIILPTISINEAYAARPCPYPHLSLEIKTSQK